MELILSKSANPVSIVPVNESKRRRLVAGSGGEVAAANKSVPVGHSGVVRGTPFFRELIEAQNSGDGIGEPVVEIEPECPEPGTAPGSQAQYEEE